MKKLKLQNAKHDFLFEEFSVVQTEIEGLYKDEDKLRMDMLNTVNLKICVIDLLHKFMYY